MKYLSRAMTAVILAVLTAVLLPVQVFADTPDYISDIKIYAGSYSEAEKEGYTILKDGDKAVDLNQNSGATGTGSKGNKAIYLGYKTTKERSEAITDLALMNMKGGYSVEDYKTLMNNQMTEQIIPFVDSFLVAIEEYRENYNSSNAANKQRAEYIHDVLNKFTDDDCDGAGLGDLLLNKTKYEMGDEAYNALSDSEKKQHADIITIIAQSNGQATLMIENLLVRAADTNEDSWIERFIASSYDDLADATDLTPSKAAKQLAKLYDDDASKIVAMWETFREELLGADEAKKKLESTKAETFEKNAEFSENFDIETATDEDIKKLGEALATDEIESEVLGNRLTDVVAKEYLSSIDFDGGTLYDFFTQSSEDIEEDITVIYPLVAALSDGQRAGLEFISLSDLVSIAGTEAGGYKDSSLDEITESSIYSGVDRGIYEENSVALTSDALREKAGKLHSDSDFSIGVLSTIMATLTLGTAIAFSVSVGMYIRSVSQIKALKLAIKVNQEAKPTFNAFVRDVTSKGNQAFRNQAFDIKKYDTLIKNAWKARETATQTVTENIKAKETELERVSARSSTCGKLAIGFGIAMIIFVAVTTYLSYRDMVERYNIEFTEIPKYMIDIKDLIGYNSAGEKIVLKNQEAYYKAVYCNRTKKDEMFKSIGSFADMNGDVGKQWLALYAERNINKAPILADSFMVVKNSNEIPAGYSNGIHMFGTDIAENLNNPLYVWNSSAPQIFVYFRTAGADASTAGSNYSAGTVALTGAAGIAVGALAAAFGMKLSGKRRKDEAVPA